MLQKQFRRVATRYDRLAANRLALVQLASIRLWLRLSEPRPRVESSDRQVSALSSLGGSRLWRYPLPNPPPQAGEGAHLLRCTFEPNLIMLWRRRECTGDAEAQLVADDAVHVAARARNDRTGAGVVEPLRSTGLGNLTVD